jgi:hypothetical protein
MKATTKIYLQSWVRLCDACEELPDLGGMDYRTDKMARMVNKVEAWKQKDAAELAQQAMEFIEERGLSLDFDKWAQKG